MVSASLFLRTTPAGGSYEVERSEVFERVREEVDLHKFFPFSPDAKEFDRYWLDHCLNPDHQDTAMSMLVFADGVRCQACGFKADAVDLYHMSHPELNKYACAVALLEDDSLTLDRDSVQAQPRDTRSLDQDQAVRNHLALATNPEALAGIQAFGFTIDAIRHFRLGWARVLVPLLPKDYEAAETAEDVEWKERSGQKHAYQWQWRYAIPVYEGGALKQCIYRKSAGYELGPKTTLEWHAGTQWLYNGEVLHKADFGVFASGWGDVIVLWQWGIPAVCSISGDGHFRPEWAEQLKRVRRPYSVTDADAAGLKLRSRLEKDIPWIRHIELGYEQGTKKDVRDYFLDGHSKEDLLLLMRQADIRGNWKILKRGK